MLTAEQRDSIRELAGQGASRIEIARRLHVSRSSVHRVLAGSSAAMTEHGAHTVPEAQARAASLMIPDAARVKLEALATLISTYERLKTSGLTVADVQTFGAAGILKGPVPEVAYVALELDQLAAEHRQLQQKHLSLIQQCDALLESRGALIDQQEALARDVEALGAELDDRGRTARALTDLVTARRREAEQLQALLEQFRSRRDEARRLAEALELRLAKLGPTLEAAESVVAEYQEVMAQLPTLRREAAELPGAIALGRALERAAATPDLLPSLRGLTERFAVADALTPVATPERTAALNVKLLAEARRVLLDLLTRLTGQDAEQANTPPSSA